MHLLYTQYQLLILECTLITIEVELTGLHQLIILPWFHPTDTIFDVLSDLVGRL